MPNPFLSIIIPTYNRAHLIENTLLSVLNQSCDDFEVIVIDDGSTDNTEEVIASLNNSKIQYYKVINGERGKARNEGTKKAIGDYVNWFDSDDEMLPNHVEIIKDFARKKNSPEIITLNYGVRESNSSKQTIGIKQENNAKFNPLILGNYLSCNAVIVSKEVAISHPFDEERSLSVSEDYELWMRLASDYDFCYTSEITTIAIQHEQQSVKTMTDATKLEERFLLFIEKTTSNEKVLQFLGKNKSYFVMRNLLFLSVELAFHKHKKKACKHVSKAFFTNPRAVFQRTFWGTVKHLLR